MFHVCRLFRLIPLWLADKERIALAIWTLFGEIHHRKSHVHAERKNSCEVAMLPSALQKVSRENTRRYQGVSSIECSRGVRETQGPQRSGPLSALSVPGDQIKWSLQCVGTQIHFRSLSFLASLTFVLGLASDLCPVWKDMMCSSGEHRDKGITHNDSFRLFINESRR